MCGLGGGENPSEGSIKGEGREGREEGMVNKNATKSQWVIDPKTYVKPTFHTEYQVIQGPP